MGYIQNLRAFVGTQPLIQVGAGVLVLDAAGRLLLQQRTDNNCWGIPGGSLEPGETLEECARRELFEETSLVAGKMEAWEIISGPEGFYEYPNGDQVYNVGVVYVSSDFSGNLRASADESKSLKFFAFDSLPKEINPADRPIIERFVQMRPIY